MRCLHSVLVAAALCFAASLRRLLPHQNSWNRIPSYGCTAWRPYSYRLHLLGDNAARVGQQPPPSDEKNKTATTIRDNVNLFAAGDIKKKTSAYSEVPTSVGTSTSTAILETLKLKEVSNVDVISNSILGSSKNRSSSMDSRIELLKLEAEKEKIIMDLEGIEKEKERIVKIDNLLLSIIGAEDKENSFSDENIEKVLRSDMSVVTKDFFYRIVELSSIETTNSSERKRLMQLCDDFMRVVQKIDPKRHADIEAAVQIEFTAELKKFQSKKNAAGGDNINVYDKVLSQWIENQKVSAAALTSNSSVDTAYSNLLINPNIALNRNRTMINFPAALPINFLPMMFSAPEVSVEDTETLRSKVFTADLLSDMKMDSNTFLVTFRGTAKDGTIYSCYSEARRRMTAEGLDGRIKLYLLPEYRLPGPQATAQGAEAGAMREPLSGISFEPTFIALSTKATIRETRVPSAVLAAFSAIASFVTTLLFSTELFTLNNKFLERLLAQDETVLGNILPVVAGVLGVQLLHDLAHYATAAAYKVQMSIPYVIPSLNIGIFGSIVNFLESPKTRAQLFDISVAGPFIGLLASLALTVYGVSLTDAATPAEMVDAFPKVPLQFFESSWLFSHLSHVNLASVTDTVANVLSSAPSIIASPGSDIAQLPSGLVTVAAPANLVPVHPLEAIGFLSLIINAFNCLPFGRLDGGRVMMSIFGRQLSSSISTTILILLAIGTFTNPSPIILFWSVYVTLFQRGADLPPENDVTPINSSEASSVAATAARSLVFAVVVAIALLTVLPSTVTFS